MRRIDGEQVELGYDQLIVALGSVSRTLPIPGLAEHASGLKSLADATALRNRVLSCMDIAESLQDPVERAEYLGFVFVGAGYAGVEGLAELQDFAAQAIDLYPRCRAQGMRWVLVEAKDRIMQEVPPGLSEFAQRELRARGIEVRTETTIKEITEREATLSDGERIPARTVVWTAGVKPSPAVGDLGLPSERDGRVIVDRTMRVEGFQHVWAIGDCAAVPDPARKGQPCPPTAQHAIRQGRLVARNVVAALGNGRIRPFRFRTKGVVAELGNQRGGRADVRRALARPAGVVHRAHLSPAADARRGTQTAPADGLERRAAVRPRHLFPGPLGQPDAVGGRRRRRGLTGVSQDVLCGPAPLACRR